MLSSQTEPKTRACTAFLPLLLECSQSYTIWSPACMFMPCVGYSAGYCNILQISQSSAISNEDLIISLIVIHSTKQEWRRQTSNRKECCASAGCHIYDMLLSN